MKTKRFILSSPKMIYQTKQSGHLNMRIYLYRASMFAINILRHVLKISEQSKVPTYNTIPLAAE